MDKLFGRVNIQAIVFLIGCFILNYTGNLKDSSLIVLLLAIGILPRDRPDKEAVKKSIHYFMRMNDVHAWVSYILLYFLIFVLGSRGTI